MSNSNPLGYAEIRRGMYEDVPPDLSDGPRMAALYLNWFNDFVLLDTLGAYLGCSRETARLAVNAGKLAYENGVKPYNGDF